MFPRGLIIFPTLEPFGSTLRDRFDPGEVQFINKYVYDTLYRTTRQTLVDSRLNKYFIKGQAQSGASSEIILPGLNISPGSVIVTAGNIPLTEGVDFTVDYNIGRVIIINDAILSSGKSIRVSFEKADLFNLQTRSLLGTRFDYMVDDNLNLGGTFLYLNERPLISRVNVGSEPLRNSIWGLDVNYNKESRFLTKMVDFLPFVQTKEPSSIQFSGEFAHLMAGTSNRVNGESTFYIDDFEAAATPFNLGQGPQQWKLGATPETDDDRFDMAAQAGTILGNSYKRARLAWYSIDNIFYVRGRRPNNIEDEDVQNHYVRQVLPQEIFKLRDREQFQVNEPIFDLAYYPSERGMYNYNVGLDNSGFLPNPRSNYGAITRAILTEVDFDRNNIEYVEFWMMDPFIQGPNGRVLDGINNENNQTGGKLIINLGDISEDVMKDSRHAFENGLPADYDEALTLLNEWGRVTRQQFLTPAFDTDPASRQNQDVGLDGLKSEDEAAYFEDFINQLNVSPQALNAILEDPSADDFKYYLSAEYDADNIKILQRYKYFNGMENNSPVLTNSNLNFTPSGSNNPDNEDLNNDNTINELEQYYEYEIDLRPGQLAIGNKYIVDQVTNTINGDEVRWYLFRIPVRIPDRVQGNIQGFKSIRFIRTYLTDFEQPVVLRMAKFQMVGSQWRRFNEPLFERGFFEIPENSNASVTVSVVNVEENSEGSAGRSPYVLPPGIERDRDNTTTVQRRLNEQSLQICIDDLEPRNSQAVFKNVNFDLVQYERLKMFIHADSETTQSGEVSAFLRLGTDFTDNYYEIEVPLTITPEGTRDPRQIWPLENEIDISIEDIVSVKAERNQNMVSQNLPYSKMIGRYKVTIVGRPELSFIQALLLGVKNPGNDGLNKSVCIWANELRVTGINNSSGWAANARTNIKLADLGTISSSIRYNSFGFGAIESRISDLSRESTTQYDVAANINAEKVLPESFGLENPNVCQL